MSNEGDNCDKHSLRAILFHFLILIYTLEHIFTSYENIFLFIYSFTSFSTAWIFCFLMGEWTICSRKLLFYKDEQSLAFRDSLAPSEVEISGYDYIQIFFFFLITFSSFFLLVVH